MMKNSVFVFLFSTYGLFAQQSEVNNQQKIDSLVTLVAKTNQDTTKVNLLNNIAREYSNVDDLENSNKYASESATLAKKINFALGQANAYTTIGRNFHDQYKQTEAIKYYKIAANIYKEKNDQKRLADLFYKLANVYNDLNNYDSALEYYFQAVKIYQNTKNLRKLAIVYGQIATIYRGLDDHTKSERYLDFSTKLLVELRDTELLTYNYLSYAQLYEKTNETDKIEYYAKKASEYAIKDNNRNSIAVSTFALGIVNKRREQYTEAILKINEALEIFEVSSNYMGMASAFNELGICYYSLYEKSQNLKQLSLAKQNFESSNKLYKEANLIDGLASNYLYISKINEKENDYKSGLANFQLYSKYNDSILNASTKETIKNIEDKRSIELQSKEIQLNKITLQNRDRQTWYFIGGICLLLFIGSLLFYQSRNRRRTNEKLQLLNAELDQANKTKTRFFSILNHDLRSPVANLIHFLHLQKDHPELMDEATKNRMQNKTISGAENLLSSMEDILLWSKGQMENFKPNPKKVTINQLFEDTKKVFSGYVSITFEYQNPEEVELIVDENYLKTIIRNLTSNAINAFAGTEHPTIIWKAWKENNKTILSITDNGPGASQDQFKALYDDKEVIGIKSGLGLHLIRDLAKAIDCTILVESKINEGTTFILKFIS